MIFSKNNNYSEITLPKNTPSTEKDPTPDISSLSDGVYKGLFYGHTFELEDGRKYYTRYGVRHSRGKTSLQSYQVKDGKVTAMPKTFSGMAEVSGALQGASYGRKPMNGENVTRITVDKYGFKIPDDTIKSLISTNKSFAKISSQSREYVGAIQQPSVSIKDDNSIIKRDDKSNGNQANAVKLNQPNSVSELNIDWSNDHPFHLGLEPYFTSPLISDTPEGIYQGDLEGVEIKCKDTVIKLGTQMADNQPRRVFCLIKGKKVYVFDIPQMVNSLGSRQFSDVESDDDFREYAHNLMRNAHKDNYSKETTDKVVSDLLKDHQGKDYGELIGRLKSGLGNKTYSDYDVNKAKMVISPIPQEMTEISYNLGGIIGTLVMSASYVHIYHLCTLAWSDHKALNDYYKEIPDLIDSVAENAISIGLISHISNYIKPEGTALEYFTELDGYVTRYLANPDNDATVHNIDLLPVLQLIRSTEYKLGRFESGTKTYSDSIVRFNSTEVDTMSDSLTDAINDYIKKYHKSPVKELTTKDDKRTIKQYVRKKVLTGKDLSELVSSLMTSISTGVKSLFR